MSARQELQTQSLTALNLLHETFSCKILLSPSSLINSAFWSHDSYPKTQHSTLKNLMVDSWVNRVVHPTMDDLASYVPSQISANSITLVGFGIGLLAVPLLWIKLYSTALALILVNRFFDGLDGAVARRNGVTNLGGYLDISCDFIFYSAVVLGFALADTEKNSLAATYLIFSFVGTGASFLAFAVIAEKHGISSEAHGRKAFYYLGGLVEGTETVLFYVIVCLFPAQFTTLAVIFGSLCWLTVVGHFSSAFSLLRN